MNRMMCILLMLSALAAPALASGKEDRDLPNFDQVSERLYRGGQPTPEGLKKLAERGIRTIISLRQDSGGARKEQAAAEALGMRWFIVPMSALSRPQDDEIQRVLSLINDPASGTVFIHCKRGADRTGAVIAIYRVSQQGWTADDALREARHYRMRWWEFGKRDFIRDYEKKRRSGNSE